MRGTVLTAIALFASGCCYDFGEDDACVVTGFPRTYCQPVPQEAVVCWSDVEPAPPLSRDYRTCTGEVHEGRDCEDLGFTSSCSGGLYFVRPGDAC